MIDESLMDAVTATSGSGPAYFFGFVEAMINASKRLGLKEEDAKNMEFQAAQSRAPNSFFWQSNHKI